MSRHIIRNAGGEQLQIEVDGIPAIDGLGTVTAASNAATLNKGTGVITSESLTTAAASTYTCTLTNAKIKATSAVFVSVGLGSSTTGTPALLDMTWAAGSLVVVVKNIHASASLNGTILIAYQILN